MIEPTAPLVDAPLLLSRYRPLHRLARGGSSSVYRGRDEVLDRDVAIKLFNSGTPEVVDRQREELRVLASLNHHGVVSIIDAGIDDSAPHDPRPFLVMELVQGITLQQLATRRQLGAREIGELGYEVAEVLEYIHSRGIIHRDITPSNIMLVDYGTEFSRPRARLTDFGIAIDALTVGHGEAGVSGTIAYLSPEQVRQKELTPTTDIYSLGLVLIECFSRTVEFPGSVVESASARLSRDPRIPAEVPEAFRALLADMTHRDPTRRPAAGPLLGRIREALRGVL